MSKPSKNLSRVARFIDRRLQELRPRRSQREIAVAAGFESPNIISMLKDGTTKLPLERVRPLARALECDPVQLARLALEQFYDASVIETILAGAAPARGDPGMDEISAWLTAIEVELLVARRSVKYARHLSQSANSSARRAEERLEKVAQELEKLSIAVRAPSGPVTAP